ncbi:MULTISPECIES: hypothetical protein [Streptomyces]|uniref:hypothetical protein n=1 Tax=Streptomyces TaxID=1883 RepID=UPI0029A4F864|nr:hypothetical protein [Streptomyces sp. WI03-4A]MDX2591359.1 hypothetical protein [Streptomyces sp. WI03-4A]
MDAETIVAITGAGISIAAAVISGSQARSAKEQLKLTKEQWKAQEEDRHEASGPQFEVESVTYGPHPADVLMRSRPGGRPTAPNDTRCAAIALRQTAGPALLEAIVRADGIYLRNLAIARKIHRNNQYGDEVSGGDAVSTGPLAAGGTATVYIDLAPERKYPFPVHLSLLCHGRDTAIPWRRDITQTLHGPQAPASGTSY